MDAATPAPARLTVVVVIEEVCDTNSSSSLSLSCKAGTIKNRKKVS